MKYLASQKVKQYDCLTRVKKRSDAVVEHSFIDIKAAKEKEEQHLDKVHKQFPSGDQNISNTLKNIISLKAQAGET